MLHGELDSPAHQILRQFVANRVLAFFAYFFKTFLVIMYHRQQNKCYPQMCLLSISKLNSILAVANLLAHNNKSQICYCGQISLQSAVLFLTI